MDITLILASSADSVVSVNGMEELALSRQQAVQLNRDGTVVGAGQIIVTPIVPGFLNRIVSFIKMTC